MSVVDNNGFDENNVKAAGQFPMRLSDLKAEELSPMMQHYAEMKAKCSCYTDSAISMRCFSTMP